MLRRTPNILGRRVLPGSCSLECASSGLQGNAGEMARPDTPQCLRSTRVRSLGPSVWLERRTQIPEEVLREVPLPAPCCPGAHWRSVEGPRLGPPSSSALGGGHPQGHAEFPTGGDSKNACCPAGARAGHPPRSHQERYTCTCTCAWLFTCTCTCACTS